MSVRLFCRGARLRSKAEARRQCLAGRGMPPIKRFNLIAQQTAPAD